MNVFTTEAGEAFDLPALVIEPANAGASTPVLLFLHGKGESGGSPQELPKVNIHQTAPFQAMLGRLPNTIVIAPQAPDRSEKGDWNWRVHVPSIRRWLARDYFRGRRLLATGFSRGGLGVLQLVAQDARLFDAVAVVDPQPTDVDAELTSITNSPLVAARAWLRYGTYRNGAPARVAFAERLEAKIPAENRETVSSDHSNLAYLAYAGDRCSTDGPKSNLYSFLGVEYVRSAGGAGPGW